MLSIVLSLGGNIIPMDVRDYEGIDAFHYQSLMPVGVAEQQLPADGSALPSDPADRFALRVFNRARADTGAQPIMRIYCGMAMQLAWIGCILGACYVLSVGAIVVWWCDVSREPLGCCCLLDADPGRF